MFRRLVTLALLLSPFAISVSAAPANAPRHPGIWLTQPDLDRIRTNVAASREPWKSAWEALEKQGPGLNTKANINDATTNNYRIQGDGHAAYILAIKWVASGDKRYADAAIKLIDDWTANVPHVDDEPMRSGLGSSQMANAAEILAHGFKGEAGWPAASVKRAQEWFKKAIYPEIKNGAAANWGTSAMTGLMSIAIFCDDREMFDRAVAAYKGGFVVNGSLKGGCCGVTQYIDATGENAESGRDQGHSQGGIAHLVEVALAAHNQGLDLVRYNDKFGVRDYGVSGANRLLIGLEYTAKYNLGENVPYHPFFEYCNDVFIYKGGISDKGRGNFSPIWEMASALFAKVGLKAPYTDKVLSSPGYTPEKSNSDHPGLGTLTFRP